MRSHSLSHSHSRSHSHSSMSRRSSMSSHRSHTHSAVMNHGSLGSRHRSSLSRMNHGSMSRTHHSSLAGRSYHSRHSSLNRNRGISNAHAYAVARVTGVNINGSAMGASGAALYRMRKIRRHTSKRSSNNRLHRRYTLDKTKYGTTNDMYKDLSFNNNANGGIFIIVVMLLFMFIAIGMFIMMTTLMFKGIGAQL